MAIQRSDGLRRSVEVKLEASRVTAFYECFDGEHLGAALNNLLGLLIEEYEREPDEMKSVLEKMYERLQT